MLVILATFVLLTCVTAVMRSKISGLSHIPGPFFARYTNIWAFCVSWRTGVKETRTKLYRELREKYGDVVRIGPHSVAVLDPEAVPVIYGLRARLDKGDAYLPFRQGTTTPSILSIQDEQTHSKYRKLVANAFSLSSLKGYEPHVDEIIKRLVDVCDQHCQKKTPMNISLWFHYYCYDVVSKLTMGQPLGFLEGQDAFNLIKATYAFGAYSNVISQMPWLHKVLQENPIMLRAKPSPFRRVVASIVDKRLQSTKGDAQDRPDLLSHFIITHGNYPELMDRNQVISSTAGNLIAGSLSPSKVCNEICYFLANSPEAQEKLFRELEGANVKFPATYDQVRQLKYLDGVIREGIRLHSSTSFYFQRVTGLNGLTLPNGTHIPPRTNVGCSSAAINQDSRVFGTEPEVYKPERWMRSDAESYEVYDERRKLMERAELSFGHGSRACIGKNLALMEIYKVVAAVVGQFKFETIGPISKKETFVSIKRRQLA